MADEPASALPALPMAAWIRSRDDGRPSRRPRPAKEAFSELPDNDTLPVLDLPTLERLLDAWLFTDSRPDLQALVRAVEDALANIQVQMAAHPFGGNDEERRIESLFDDYLSAAEVQRLSHTGPAEDAPG